MYFYHQHQHPSTIAMWLNPRNSPFLTSKYSFNTKLKLLLSIYNYIYIVSIFLEYFDSLCGELGEFHGPFLEGFFPSGDGNSALDGPGKLGSHRGSPAEELPGGTA